MAAAVAAAPAATMAAAAAAAAGASNAGTAGTPIATPGTPTEAAPVSPLTAVLSEDLEARVLSYLDVWDRRAMAAVDKRYAAMQAPVLAPARAAVASFRKQPEEALLALASLGLLTADTAGVARFLYDAHGKLPAAAVGKYLTAPGGADREEEAEAAYQLTTAYLAHLDLTYDTPAQALRKLLNRTRLPPGSRVLSALFKRLSERYVACQHAAARECATFGSPPAEDDAPAAAAGGVRGVSGGAAVDMAHAHVQHAASVSPSMLALGALEHAGGSGGRRAGAAATTRATAATAAAAGGAGAADAHLPPWRQRAPAATRDDDDDDIVTVHTARVVLKSPETACLSIKGGDSAAVAAPVPPPSSSMSDKRWVELDGLHGDEDAGAYGLAPMTPSVPTVAVAVAVAVPPPPPVPSSSPPPPVQPPKPRRRMLYGFDVVTLDHDVAFIFFYSLLILNCDMRSPAVRTKMTRTDFVSRNISIPALAHIPPTFFAGAYDEIALAGLPVADGLPVAPARHALARNPAPETGAILQPMMDGPPAAPSPATRAIAATAAAAVSWVKRAAAALTQSGSAASVPVPVAAAQQPPSVPTSPPPSPSLAARVVEPVTLYRR